LDVNADQIAADVVEWMSLHRIGALCMHSPQVIHSFVRLADKPWLKVLFADLL
jgi:hypothetical protein